jgi:hypothetical protein
MDDLNAVYIMLFMIFILIFSFIGYVESDIWYHDYYKHINKYKQYNYIHHHRRGRWNMTGYPPWLDFSWIYLK